MRSPLYLPLLLVLFVVFFVVGVERVNAAVYININPNATCVAQGLCNFFDNNTWIGGLYPGPSDQVLIQSPNRTSPVTFFIDSSSPQGNNVTLYYIIVYDSIFVIENVTAYFSFSLYSDSSSTFRISNSNVSTPSLAIYYLSLNSSSLSFAAVQYTLRTINITDSTISSPDTLYFYTLNAFGNVVFNCDLGITSSATFNNVPNLQLNSVIVSYYGNLTFNDSPSNVSMISYSSNCYITYYASSPATASHFIGSLTLASSFASSSLLSLGNFISLTVYSGGSSRLGLNMGNFSSVTVPGTTSYKYSQAAFAPGKISPLATFNTSGSLSFYGGLVPANVYVAETGKLSIYSLTNFGIADGSCVVSGPGRLELYASFYSKGPLKIGSVYIQCSATLTVPSLTTTSISGCGTIHGDVETESLYLSSTLTISGDFSQRSGNITASPPYASKDTPILVVEGKLELSVTEVSLHLSNFFEEIDAEYQFAEFEKFSKIHLGHLVDASTYNHKLSYKVAEEGIFIGRDRPYFARNWQWMLVLGVMGIILILIVWCISCAKNSSAFKSMENHDPHISIKDYFSDMKTKNLTAGAIVAAVIIGLLFLPLFLESIVFTIALAVFIPFGFFIGIFEHRFVFLWAVIVLFIQLGGLLDLFADITLVAKFFIFYFDNSFGIKNPNDKEIAEDLEVLSLVRLGITLGGSFMTLFFLWMMTSVFGKFLHQLTGKPFIYDPKGNINIRGSGVAFGLLVLLCIMLWKVVLMAFRVHLLFSVAKSLFTRGRLTDDVQRKVQWIELILFVDLMWSGFPLGVLTGYELFFYNEKLDMSGELVFELLKMGALAVDLVGACFLIYYVIFGLNHKCPGLHHDPHHSELHNAHGATVSVDVTDKTPLLVNNTHH